MKTGRSLRVAVVGACPYPVPQGSQVYLTETARALQDRGHDVRLVVYGYGTGNAPVDVTVHGCGRFLPAGKTGAGPSLAKPLRDAAMVAGLRRVAAQYDVVDAHNYEALLVALAARVKPVVYHAHNAMADELPYYAPPGLKAVARTLGRWLDRKLPRRADAVVAPHERLRAYLVDCGCVPSRVHVIPPSVDGRGIPECVRTKGPVPTLYTGNVDAYQNLGLLRRAMDLVHTEAPDAELEVATAAEKAARKVFSNARVVLTPDFAALRKVLAHEAVFVCPRVSWSGYPIKVLNAMAAGLPIVCCASSAHALTDGVTGVVVADSDPQAMAAAIVRLMKDPAERMRLGATARREALDRHDPARAGEALEQVLKAVAWYNEERSMTTPTTEIRGNK